MKNHEKKKKALLSSVFLSTALLLAACGQGTPPDVGGNVEPEPDQEAQVVEDATNENLEEVALDEVKQEKDQMEQQLEDMEDELNYYKKYVKQVYLQLGEKKQNALKEQEWEYRLLVNGVGFPSNGVIEVEAPRLEVVMSEQRVPYSVIPEEDSEEAQLQSPITSSFMMRTKEGFEVEEDKEEDGTRHILKYISDGVEDGEIYEITITDALREKLKLQTNDLIIKVR